MNSKHARTHTHTRRAGGAWCGQWRVCVWCGRWGRDTEDLGRSRSTNARGTHAQESHAAPRGGGGATGRRRNANAATQQQRGGCRVFGVGGHGGHQGAREGGCERTSVRSECQSLLGYVSPCGEEPVAAAAISARLPCLRFAPCVVRAFFYAFMYIHRGVSIDSKQRPSTAPCLRDPSQTCGCACGDRSDGHVHRHVPDAARHAQAPARTSGPLPAQRTPRHLPPPAAARLCRHQAALQRRSSGSVRAQHALIMRPPTGAQPRNDRLLCAHDMEGNALVYMYTHVDTDVRVLSTCMHRIHMNAPICSSCCATQTTRAA